MGITPRSRSAAIRSSSATFNRFLKPGALARLRDSRISTAKSHSKWDANSQISGSRVPSPSRTNPGIDPLQIDEGFAFTMRVFGPRFLQRKKLGARKAVAVAPASPAADVNESAMESFAADIAAH